MTRIFVKDVAHIGGNHRRQAAAEVEPEPELEPEKVRKRVRRAVEPVTECARKRTRLARCLCRTVSCVRSHMRPLQMHDAACGARLHDALSSGVT